MTYLVGQLLTCLSLAGLLGVLIGWLVWGLTVRKERQRVQGLESRLAVLEPLPGKLKDLETAHAVLQTSRAAEAAKFTQRIGELEPQAAKLVQVEKNLVTKTAEADGLRKQVGDLTNTYKTEIEQRDQQLKALQGQIQDSQKKLSDAETRHAAALKAKDAEIAQHVSSHADKDARLASLLGRVAETKTVADRVPLLESQIAQHVAVHAEKDAKIAELAPLAALVPALKSDLADRDTKINGLMSQVGDLQPQAARVGELETAHAAKDSKIAELSSVAELVPVLQSHVAEKDAQIRAHEAARAQNDAKIDALLSNVHAHEAAHAEKDAKIAELAAAAALVPVLQSKISEHEAAHAEKDAQLYAHEQVQKVKDTKIAELASLSEWVPTLHAQVGEKDAKIAELAPLAALVPELKAQLSDKDTHISGLLGQLDQLHGQIVQHEAAQNDSAQVAELRSALDAKDAEVAQHQEAHAAKDAHIASLTSRVEDAEYENNLNTRKMRMQDAGSAVSEQEMARLHEQVTLLTAQLANVNEQHAATVAELTKLQAPPMAMAAAAGFYSGTTTVAPRTQEYEKHIDELQSAAQAREAEVAKLRQRVAEIEAAPDPDSKRQILSAAKDAEIKHLKETLNALFAPLNNDDVAARAYNYAKERGFVGGSQTEDWLRAERDTHFARLAAAWEGTRTGTLY